MLLQLRGGRRIGAVIAACAVAILFAPLLLPGREGEIPLPTWSIETVLPTIVAYIVVALSDRAYAWPIAFIVALALWRYARRHLSPEARFVLSLDRRPPVLLLRSFIDDASAVNPSDLSARISFGGKRLEEVAADAVKGISPFIAVGDPRSRLPPLGAFRANLPDDWQTPVKEWIGGARAILLIAGTTEWVTWELQQIVAADALGRVLLLIPPGAPEDIDARWRHVAAHIGSPSLQSAMEAIDPKRVLAVRFTRDGGLQLLTASLRRERDYGLAVHVGLPGILAQQTQAHSVKSLEFVVSRSDLFYAVANLALNGCAVLMMALMMARSCRCRR